MYAGGKELQMADLEAIALQLSEVEAVIGSDALPTGTAAPLKVAGT